MPRNGEKVRRRLQEAALELYRVHGYDETTTAEIAKQAGVTERTFFRHFVDKREVVFDGEAALSTILTQAVLEAPAALGPWATLYRAFRASQALLVENRPLAEVRRRVIATSPALQERELAKAMSMTVKLAAALRERGVSDRLASLAAQTGMAAFSQAYSLWIEGDSGSFDTHLVRAFHEVRALTASPVSD